MPFGSKVILLLAPSGISIVPEFVPEFVLRVRSPVPLVVIIAFSLDPPTLTVSVFKEFPVGPSPDV